MGVSFNKAKRNQRRIKRVRKKIFGTEGAPRVVITQTNRNLYVQAVDDIKGNTLSSVSSIGKELGLKTNNKKSVKVAELLGEKLSEKLKKGKIKRIVLDRRVKKYHGIVKSFAEKLREKGIKF